MALKNRERSKKAKTNFEVDALNLAAYLDSNFVHLQNLPLQMNSKNDLGRRIQKYLDSQTDRIHENKLIAIIGIHDVFRNHTGGRIHLIAGLKGPFIESMQQTVVPVPIDYEYKHRFLTKAIEIASGIKSPKSGNIHFHLFHCSQRIVTPRTLLDLIRSEHGYQNDLQQIADSRIHILINTESGPYWRPNVNTEMVQVVFGA